VSSSSTSVVAPRLRESQGQSAGSLFVFNGVRLSSGLGGPFAFAYASPMTNMQSPPLKHLGRESRLPDAPDAATLDRVPNPHADLVYAVRFVAPEFTCLCPMTGQPDFAHLVIDYAPKSWLVESKSLKLYLMSYRNHGAFHEDCTLTIAKHLVGLIDPRWLRIGGYWFPRGGMPIDVFWQTDEPPSGLFLPDQGVAPYRGRG